MDHTFRLIVQFLILILSQTHDEYHIRSIKWRDPNLERLNFADNGRIGLDKVEHGRENGDEEL
jgi:hypothetical protein